MNLRIVRLGTIGLALGLGTVAGLTYYFQQSPKQYVQDTPTHLPQLGGPFRLVDQFGRTRTDQEFRGKYMLIYFGYSFCPDVCPLGLQNVSAALTELRTDIDHIAPLFITIDPQRDDVKSLNLYAQNWHSSFVMLTGTPQQINPVLKAYKVYAVPVKPEGTAADYLIDHSALIYLVNREGVFVDFFPHTTAPTEIAQKIRGHLLREIQG